jgi:hypothetical protein
MCNHLTTKLDSTDHTSYCIGTFSSYPDRWDLGTGQIRDAYALASRNMTVAETSSHVVPLDLLDGGEKRDDAPRMMR